MPAGTAEGQTTDFTTAGMGGGAAGRFARPTKLGTRPKKTAGGVRPGPNVLGVYPPTILSGCGSIVLGDVMGMMGPCGAHPNQPRLVWEGIRTGRR